MAPDLATKLLHCPSNLSDHGYMLYDRGRAVNPTLRALLVTSGVVLNDQRLDVQVIQ